MSDTQSIDAADDAHDQHYVEGYQAGYLAGRKHQKQADLEACDHVADLYGEDSERGLAAADVKRRILNG